jgi:hypothetical protein
MTTFTQSSKRTLSDSTPSHSVKKPCGETVSVFGRVRDLLKYHVVWYNEHHENPLEYYNISSKFRRGIVDYLECFVSIEKCKEYIQSLANDGTYIILIVSIFISSSMQLTDDKSLLDSVPSIYIHQEGSDQLSYAENSVENVQSYEKV